MHAVLIDFSDLRLSLLLNEMIEGLQTIINK